MDKQSNSVSWYSEASIQNRMHFGTLLTIALLMKQCYWKLQTKKAVLQVQKSAPDLAFILTTDDFRNGQAGPPDILIEFFETLFWSK